MTSRLRVPTRIALWPGESVTVALERLTRSWDLDRVRFTGRSGSVARAAVRVDVAGQHRPRTRPVSWADVVYVAGEVRVEDGRPVADVKVVLRRSLVLEGGNAEYLAGDLVGAEVRDPVELLLADGDAADDEIAADRLADVAGEQPAEGAAVIV